MRKDDVFLDLGAGSGNSFNVASMVLDSPRFVSIESNSSASSYYAKKFGVTPFRNIEDFKSEGKKAQFILLSHSLEHFRFDEVHDLLEGVFDILDDQGVCVIEVPNSNLRLNSGKIEEDAPHLLFFTRATLENLFLRMGFTIYCTQIVGSPWKDVAAYPATSLPRLKRLFSKFLSKLSRVLDQTQHSIDISSHGNLFNNFTINDEGSVLRMVVGKPVKH
jgi:hypothetical protein